MGGQANIIQEVWGRSAKGAMFIVVLGDIFTYWNLVDM